MMLRIRTIGMALLLLVSISLTTLTAALHANNFVEDSAIFFAGARENPLVRNLYRLVDQGQPEFLEQSLPESPISFSPDNHYVAFGVAGGLVTTALDDWSPSVVVRYFARLIDGRVLSSPVETYWSPSSDRLIYTVYSMDNADFFPGSYLMSRIGTEDTFDPDFWPWSQCDQLARQIRTGQLALICVALPPYVEQIAQNDHPAAVAVFFDGSYQDYIPEEYSLVLGQPGVPLPHYEWLFNTGTETLIFNQADAGRPSGTATVYVINGDQSPRALLPYPVQQTPPFTTSPDRRYIAFVEHVVREAGSVQNCMRIADFTTGAVIWGGNDEYCVMENSASTINLTAWYPDSLHVAVSGTTPELGAYIRRLDLTTGDSALLLKGYARIEALAIAPAGP